MENKQNFLDIQTALKQYIQQLDDVESKILNLAKLQLESSFEITKTIGFLDFLKSNNIIIS